MENLDEILAFPVLEFERSRLQLSPKCSGAGWLRARN